MFSENVQGLSPRPFILHNLLSDRQSDCPSGWESGQGTLSVIASLEGVALEYLSHTPTKGPLTTSSQDICYAQACLYLTIMKRSA
jgi:hypothetical protein